MKSGGGSGSTSPGTSENDQEEGTYRTRERTDVSGYRANCDEWETRNDYIKQVSGPILTNDSEESSPRLGSRRLAPWELTIAGKRSYM